MANITEQIPDTFRFSIPLPMRWNDMDALGHVNNIYYFEYFQIARAEYMLQASNQWDWTKNMFVIAHIACDYYRELTLFSGSPIIKTRTAAISNKSFEMEYLITSLAEDGTEIIHAKGKSINVMVDIIVKKSIPIPTWLRSDLEEYEADCKNNGTKTSI